MVIYRSEIHHTPPPPHAPSRLPRDFAEFPDYCSLFGSTETPETAARVTRIAPSSGWGQCALLGVICGYPDAPPAPGCLPAGCSGCSGCLPTDEWPTGPQATCRGGSTHLSTSRTGRFRTGTYPFFHSSEQHGSGPGHIPSFTAASRASWRDRLFRLL